MANLKATLIDGGIDLSKWGVGKAKTVSTLEKEIFFGETVISKDANGKLIRTIRICFANVYHTTDEGERYLLKQKLQTLPDGRKRKRQHDNSMSEKCQFDEDKDDSIARGLYEELGVKKPVSIKYLGEKEEILEPDSYPGLMTTYTTYEFEVELSKSEFNLDGYHENENGLLNNFYWEKLV